MKRIKRGYKICVLALILSIASPVALPVSNVIVAEAAAIKISNKKLTLTVGKSKTLKITGTKKKATWTTNKKSVATVKNGKVTAKKAGKAKITATVDKKKYTCVVTVNKASNPAVDKAPFKAVEVKQGKVKFVIPEDWDKSILFELGNNALIQFYPKSADIEKGTSSVVLTVAETGTPALDYEIAKETFKEMITEEFLVSQFSQSGLDVKITGLVYSDYKAKLGTAFKTELKLLYEDKTIEQAIYDLYIDNYLLELTVSNIGDEITPNIDTVAEYLLNSIQVTK